MDWTPIIVAGIMGIPGVLALIQQRKKESAEASGILVGTSLKMLEAIQKDIDSLKRRMRCLEFENSWLRNGVGLLIQQLRYHGIEPDFSLDSMPEMPEEE